HIGQALRPQSDSHRIRVAFGLHAPGRRLISEIQRLRPIAPTKQPYDGPRSGPAPAAGPRGQAAPSAATPETCDRLPSLPSAPGTTASTAQTTMEDLPRVGRA